MEGVHAKLYLQSARGVVKEIRRVHLAGCVGWDDMRVRVKEAFGLGCNDFELSYQDPENDQVVMSCEVEWQECLHIADRSQPLRISVRPRRERRSPHERACDAGEGAVPRRCGGRVWAEPSHFYTSDGEALPGPQQLKGIQEVVSHLVERFVSEGLEVAEWLFPAAKRNGDLMDVDIKALGHSVHRRGLELMKVGDIDSACEMFQFAAQLPGHVATSLYNVACCQALRNRTEEAVESLRRAVREGYRRLEHMLEDEDLSSLRHTPGFEEVVAELMALRGAGEPQGKAEEESAAKPDGDVPPGPAAVSSAGEEAKAEEGDAKEEERKEEATEEREEEGSGEAAPKEEAAEEVRDPLREKYSEELRRLSGMGFDSVETCVVALESSRGSLAGAIDFLLRL